MQQGRCFIRQDRPKQYTHPRASGGISDDILVADEEFWVGERGSEDEKCIAFFTASQ
jgi:hypothetical protein